MANLKKFFVRLVGWKEQRGNFAERRFREQEAVEHSLSKEREKEAQERMRRMYEEQGQTPDERVILGPSNSEEK